MPSLSFISSFGRLLSNVARWSLLPGDKLTKGPLEDGMLMRAHYVWKAYSDQYHVPWYA
jgi:hypothetical protein